MRALCNSLAVFARSRSLTDVMTAASIGAAKGGGYARYLESKTVEPERGDYYLSPEGEPTQAPGRWLAAPDTLARLGIEGEAVDGPDFIALMEGRHPRTRRWLRPEGAGGGRGGGIDLTFSAPKSVSAVWALGDESQRRDIEDAHAAAVSEAMAHLTETVPTVRRRYGGAGRRGARHGAGRRRVPAHDRARRDRGRRAGPAATQPRRCHERGPRRRADRRGRLPADLPVRARARRVLPLGARARARTARLRDRARAPASRAATSRSPASAWPAGCLLGAQPRGRAGSGALPREVGPGARARGAAHSSSSRTARRRCSSPGATCRRAWSETAARFDFAGDRRAAAARTRRATAAGACARGSRRGAPDRARRDVRAGRVARGAARAVRRRTLARARRSRSRDAMIAERRVLP